MAELNLKNLLKSAEKLNIAEEKEIADRKYQQLYEGEFIKLFINQKNWIKVERKNDPESEYNKNLRMELEQVNEVLKVEVEAWTSNDEEATKNQIRLNNFKIAESLKEWRYAGMVFRNLESEEDVVRVLSRAMKSKWYKGLAYQCGIMAKINGKECQRKVAENRIPSLEKRFGEIVWEFEGGEDEDRYIDALDSDWCQLTE